ncbi:MAG TPA: hypothetical protein ENN46_03930 [Candidatus Woesearchaeota archaeon]|nr:hypothetical protein [Candidatus Woesearchaeota archaeon]
MGNFGLNLDSERVFEIISNERPKILCLQLPDGLKPKAKQLADSIRERFPKLRVFIWSGSNYGACDVPAELEGFVDLLISFGHAEFC